MAPVTHCIASSFPSGLVPGDDDKVLIADSSDPDGYRWDFVANTNMADMAAVTLKGRAVGAGTGKPQDLTATQGSAIIHSVILAADWDIGEDRAILAENFRARDNEGLNLYNDGPTLLLSIQDGDFVRSHNTLQVRGNTTPTVPDLDGIELIYDTDGSYDADTGGTGVGHVRSFNHTTPAWKDLRLSANAIGFWTAGGLRAVFTSAGHLLMAAGIRLDTSEVRANSVGGIFITDAAGLPGVYVANGGNVGLGTNSPQGRVHVDGVLYLERNTTSLQFYATGTGARDRIYSDANNDLFFVSYRHQIWQDEIPNEFMRLTDVGRLGIGKTDPQLLLHVLGGIALERDTGNPVQWFAGNNARNKLYCDTSNVFFSQSFGAWVWETNTPTELMRLTAAGALGVGVVVPLGKLHVAQASTTAAIPTLELQQADLSEEFFNFIATSGAGNPIDTAALGTYFGKIRVAVNGTFKFMPLYNT